MKLINDPEAMFRSIKALPEGAGVQECPHGSEPLLGQIDDLLKLHGLEVVRTDGASDGVVFWIHRLES
jgi:hypothetical protein